MNIRSCKLSAFLWTVCLVMALAPASAVSAAGAEGFGETGGKVIATVEQGDAGEFLAWLRGADDTTHTLTTDMTIEDQAEPIRVSGTKVLDLAGHKLTFADHTGRWLELAEGASLTIYGNGKDTAQSKPETANIIFPVINNDKDGTANYEVIYAGKNTDLYFYGVYIHVQNAHGPAKAVYTQGDLTAKNSAFELDAGTCALCMDSSTPKAPCKDNPYNAIYGKGGTLTITDSDVKVSVLKEATASREDPDQTGGRKTTYCHTLTLALESEEANVTVTGGSLVIEDELPDESERKDSTLYNRQGASGLYAVGTGSQTVTLNHTRISSDPYQRYSTWNYGIRCDNVQVVLDNIDLQMGAKEVGINGFTYSCLNYRACGLYLLECGKVDIRNIADDHFKLITSGFDMVGVYMSDCENVTINGFGTKDGENKPSLTAKKEPITAPGQLLNLDLTMFQFSGSTHVTTMKDVYFTVNGEASKGSSSPNLGPCGIYVNGATIDEIENMSMECRTTSSELNSSSSVKYPGCGIYQTSGTVGTVKNATLDLYNGCISGIKVKESTGDNMSVDGMKINLHDLYGAGDVYAIGDISSLGSIKALNDVQITLTLHGEPNNWRVKFRGLLNTNAKSPILIGENVSITVPSDANYGENCASYTVGIYSASGLTFPTPADSTTPQKLVKTTVDGNDVWSLGYPPRGDGDGCICDEGCTNEKWHHFCPVCAREDGGRSENPCQAFVRVSSWAELCKLMSEGTINFTLTQTIEVSGRPATVPEGKAVVIKGLAASGGDPSGTDAAPAIRRMDDL